jgi:hypothetical protein
VNIQGKGIGVNAAFDTGVMKQPINTVFIDNLPCEPAVGVCNTREFSTPQLFNVKNLGPWFHDASAATLKAAVEFYDSPAFNNSPAGTAIGGITIGGPDVDDVVAFLEGLSEPATTTMSAIANAVIAEDTATGPLAFTVSPGSATLSATSSNLVLVPNANIVFGGSGASRTVTVTPAANQSGTATITLNSSDGVNTATQSFLLTVNNVKRSPHDDADRERRCRRRFGRYQRFVYPRGCRYAGRQSHGVGQFEHNALHSVMLGGAGADRTATITPEANRFGTATIIITVSDGTLGSSRSFSVTVTNVDDLPTISDISSRVTDEDIPTGPVAFTVNDIDDPAIGWTLGASSSNTALFPAASLVIGGGGTTRTITRRRRPTSSALQRLR